MIEMNPLNHNWSHFVILSGLTLHQYQKKTAVKSVKIIPNFTENKMDIDEQSVNDILDLDEEHEGWSYFSIKEELPLLTNNCLTKRCEEIATDIDTF